MKELIDIQTKLKAPKNQYNKFGGYNYRNCEDILEALKPLLAEKKCLLTISDDIVMIGNRHYVKATVLLTNESGEHVQTIAFAREEEVKKGMDASQITGASSSYARKYALNGMFCIDDNKDSDNTNKGNSEDTNKNAQPASNSKKIISRDILNDQKVMNKMFEWLYKSESEAKKNNSRFSPTALIEKNYHVTSVETNTICEMYQQYKVNNSL